jgi:hypothetical protein
LLSSRVHAAWGYSVAGAAAVEPTALATLALHNHGIESDLIRPALQWLARVQQSGGSVPVTPVVDSPCWVTALAVLAWRSCGHDDQYQPSIERAVGWLLRTQGQTLPHNPSVFGHDTSLVGWSWVEGTHSWVEPSAYAILALRAAGRSNHPRVREGLRLLVDRAIPEGGWNYGNVRVFHNTLRPFPGPSGVALTALAGEPLHPRIQAGIDYLERELPRIRSPISLAWGLIGLTAWRTRPAEADAWLAESAERSLRKPANPLHDALLLLASADPCLLHPVPPAELLHG